MLIKQIACGTNHTLLLSKRGELFSIGSNEHGQLGLNDRTLEMTTAPLLVSEVQGQRLDTKWIGCGADHCALLTYGGCVYTWGSNLQGQCGHIGEHAQGHSPSFSRVGKSVFQPAKVNLAYVAVAADCGRENTAILTSSKQMFMWGSNAACQLGTGTPEASSEPHAIELPDQEPIQSFSLGCDYALIVGAHHRRVYGIGNNAHGQLVAAGQRAFVSAQPIPGLDDAQQVVAGSTFSAALRDGELLVWGTGPFGRADRPRLLDVDASLASVHLSKYTTTSKGFGVALAQDGKAYAWGANHNGQLGTGDYSDTARPVHIHTLRRKKVSAIAVGQSFVVMLGQDISQEELERKKERRRQRKDERRGGVVGKRSTHKKERSRTSGGHRSARFSAARTSGRQTPADVSRLDATRLDETRRYTELEFRDIKAKQEF